MKPKDKPIFDRMSWKKEYTVVLLLNTLYILLFYHLMTHYS